MYQRSDFEEIEADCLYLEFGEFAVIANLLPCLITGCRGRYDVSGLDFGSAVRILQLAKLLFSPFMAEWLLSTRLRSDSD